MRAIQVRWMVAGLATVGVLAAGGIAWRLAVPSAKPQPAARTVERVDSDSVTAKGTVEPASDQSLSFSLTGTVTSVTVKPGDTVVVGQLLARIDNADALQAVNDAQSALDDDQAALDAAWASASATPSPAASCRANAPAPRPSTARPSAPQPSAPASHGSSPSATASARPSASRSMGIQAAYAVYAAGQSCTGSGGSGGGSGGAGGGSQRGGGGGDAILTAQQALNNDEATLAKAERDLDGTVIKSPVSGKVLTVSIKVGDTARSNVITLGVVSTMVVVASFSEADVVALKVGQSASVVLPGRSDETFTAKITQIAETGTVSNNLVTYAVTLTFDQVPQGILVGQSANVTVTA
jgi:HlyD family secretion protein